MRKVIVTLAVAAALIGGMFVVSPSGASAQGGCKEFGQVVRAAAQQPGPFGQTVKLFAPVNDEFAAAKEFLCADVP